VVDATGDADEVAALIRARLSALLPTLITDHTDRGGSR
jgi:hypothetical protein